MEVTRIHVGIRVVAQAQAFATTAAARPPRLYRVTCAMLILRREWVLLGLCTRLLREVAMKVRAAVLTSTSALT
jgi:hypothetical protein